MKFFGNWITRSGLYHGGMLSVDTHPKGYNGLTPNTLISAKSEDGRSLTETGAKGYFTFPP